ncbi:MAG: major capsid protein [Thermoproteota archaeon]
MANRIFREVPGSKVKRNAFNLSHERKLSLDMGKLVPILCTEVVPGDTFRVNSEIMLRFAPMFFPVMHRIDVYVHYFFVPNRIIWNEFEEFITGGDDGKANPIFPRIRINPSNWDEWDQYHGHNGSLADYLGVPYLPAPAQGSVHEISALPFRAYAKIYDEYYRDQDLMEPINMSSSSGIITTLDNVVQLQDRCWEKDYFTSARPWAQKGESVTLPMAGAGQLDVELDYNSLDGNNSAKWIYADGQEAQGGNIISGPTGTVGEQVTDPGPHAPVWYEPYGSMKVDLSQANFTAATINELRRAFQLQKWMERNARSGSRYTEVLRAHFGVKSSDARLQRPEYLGGGRQKVSISEVLQTSETTENSPQGEMAGHGISIGNTNRFKAFFEEHGYVIGIMSVLPRTAYQQGLPRHLQKFDRFDYYWREFAHIGEQEIKNNELYVQSSRDANNETFGYAPRYSEYKYLPSTVHGDMRSTLNAWHLGRIFSEKPVLNEEFVKSNPSLRIFNVETNEYHHLWCHIYNNVKAIRPMPVFGEPGLIDH